MVTKTRILILTGGALLLVGMATVGYWFATRPQRITVRFMGYEVAGVALEASPKQGWMAVFSATNGTSTEVSCHARFPPEPNERIPVCDMTDGETLAAYGGATWRYPVSDTNSVRRLEIACFERTSPLFRRLAVWVVQHPSLDPNHRMVQALLSRGRYYVVTCPTETP